jgi:hypothetical protein
VVQEQFDDNTEGPPATLPDLSVNNGTAFVWWQFMECIGTGQQGIYYQIDNNNELSVEWLLQDMSGLVYQFIANYNASTPGLINFYYFATGNGGADATIGVQGNDSNGSELHLR